MKRDKRKEMPVSVRDWLSYLKEQDESDSFIKLREDICNKIYIDRDIESINRRDLFAFYSKTPYLVDESLMTKQEILEFRYKIESVLESN